MPTEIGEPPGSDPAIAKRRAIRRGMLWSLVTFPLILVLFGGCSLIHYDYLSLDGGMDGGASLVKHGFPAFELNGPNILFLALGTLVALCLGVLLLLIYSIRYYSISDLKKKLKECDQNEIPSEVITRLETEIPTLRHDQAIGQFEFRAYCWDAVVGVRGKELLLKMLNLARTNRDPGFGSLPFTKYYTLDDLKKKLEADDKQEIPKEIISRLEVQAKMRNPSRCFDESDFSVVSSLCVANFRSATSYNEPHG